MTGDFTKALQACLDYRARIDHLELENAALRKSHSAIYLALGTDEVDHTKWPEQILELRAELSTLNAERAEVKELRKQWAAECDANAALKKQLAETVAWPLSRTFEET